MKQQCRDCIYYRPQRVFKRNLRGFCILLVETKQADESCDKYCSEKDLWEVVTVKKCLKCEFRYQKWKPVQEGWFCKLTKEECLKEKCPKRR